MRISVIIPIYNVKNYIRRCIDSVLNQTFCDFELILVDDGSTDGCSLICDEYAKRDSRIRVVHKINGGLSSARNAGIDIARGKLIAFIDGDDYAQIDMLKDMYETAVNNNADIVACNFIFEKSELNKENVIFNKTHKSLILDNRQAMECLLKKYYFDNAAWNKIYKRELFIDIRFPEGKLFEDIFTVYKLFSKANKVVYIDKPLIYYVQRSTSIMRLKFNEKKKDRVIGSQERHHFIERNYPTLAEISYARYIDEILATINDCLRCGTSLDPVDEYIIYIKKNFKHIIYNSNIRILRKGMLAILKVNKHIYSVIFYIFRKLRG